MQQQTCLILFCVVAVLFVRFNDGAPTKSTTTVKSTSPKVRKTTPPAKSILVGGHTVWETNIKAKHLKIFNDYKNITLKKLQEVHKVPASFDPKPAKFSRQVVGGINYLYLVKLPINRYAFISIHHRVWKKDHYGQEENVHIRPQTYDLNDKTT